MPETQNRAMIRCQRCILPESYPGIRVVNGICNYCSSWDVKWSKVDYQQKAQDLEKILVLFRGKSKPYDCVIGLSGGKDSCYVALLSKKFGLNPIAVTFDNQFLTDSAKTNISHTLKALDIPHVFISSDTVFLKKLYRHFLIKAGEFCSVCNIGICGAMYRVAKKYGIRLILSGHSPRTEAFSPPEFFVSNSSYCFRVVRGFFPYKNIMEFAFIRQSERIIRHVLKSPLYLKPANYLPWEEQKMIQDMRNQLEFSSVLWEQHFDCRMSDVKEFLKWKHFGVTEKAAKLSSLIRDHQITRGEALNLVQSYEEDLSKNQAYYEDLIKKTFDLRAEDYQESLKADHTRYLSSFERAYSRLKRKYLKV